MMMINKNNDDNEDNKNNNDFDNNNHDKNHIFLYHLIDLYAFPSKETAGVLFSMLTLLTLLARHAKISDSFT